MNPNDALKFAKEALDRALEEKKFSQDIIKNLGPAILDSLKPFLTEMVSNSKTTKEELLDAVSKIKIDIPATNVPEAKVTVEIPDIKVPQPIVNVTVPDIKIPEFPEVKLPTINIPAPQFHFDATKIRIPDIRMPDEMNISGWIGLMGYDRGLLSNPLPVQLRDASGNPLNLFENITQILGGSGGGKMDYFTIKGFSQSAFSEIMNPDGNVKVSIVSGALTSVISEGPTVADTPDDGSAPIQIGGVARTANPTAVAANDVVKATYDDVGRQLIRPIQVRDLIKTAYISVTGGTETTLRAAVAGAYLDLIMIKGTNNSDAAVSVDIRAITGGNIVDTLYIPANSMAGWSPRVPWPQDETGNNWTVDGPDETGRTMTFTALFSQEV